MHTDPIADLLTRVRNAIQARRRIVEIPSSRIKLGIVEVLHNMGYIENFKYVPDNKQGLIKIALRYDPITKRNAISEITRISKPGLRKYTNTTGIPRVKNGLGIAILTTSRGIMTGKQARANNVGGEILCFVS
jgi:small subunit ribosomal protein S8